VKQPEIHSTTILSVRRGSQVVVAGDGQVTLGNQVVKGGAKKVRRLEAMLVVADGEATFIISGSGDVIEPDDGVCAIGSGGGFALAAARALFRNTELSPRQIAEQAMAIAADICIYTNSSLTIEELP